MTAPDERNLVAQWALDTRPVWLRFHPWLENVEVEACKARSFVEAIHVARTSNIRCAAQGSLFHLLLPQF